jgi:hypothetical protein
MRGVTPGDRRQQNSFQRGESVGERLNTGEEGALSKQTLSAMSVGLSQTAQHVLALTASQVFLL